MYHECNLGRDNHEIHQKMPKKYCYTSRKIKISTIQNWDHFFKQTKTALVITDSNRENYAIYSNSEGMEVVPGVSEQKSLVEMLMRCNSCYQEDFQPYMGHL